MTDPNLIAKLREALEPIAAPDRALPVSALKRPDAMHLHLSRLLDEARASARSALDSLDQLPAADASGEHSAAIERVHTFDDAAAECRRVHQETTFANDVSDDQKEWFKRGAQTCAAMMQEMARQACRLIPLSAWSAATPQSTVDEGVRAVTDIEREAAFLIALAEHGIDASVGELLTLGDHRGTVAPGALRKALRAALHPSPREGAEA